MKKIVVALLAGFVFSSCVPSTPQARIDKNPQAFAGLSTKHQALVKQGNITTGMPLDAVMLAWGNPERKFEGSKKSKRTERWDYTGSRPVYSANYFGTYGYGYGYSPYGPGRYATAGLGLGPEVAYVPYRVASVWFVENRVDSWEKVR